MLTDKEGILLVQSYLELIEIKNTKIWSLKYDLEQAQQKINDLEEKLKKEKESKE